MRTFITFSALALSRSTYTMYPRHLREKRLRNAWETPGETLEKRSPEPVPHVGVPGPEAAGRVEELPRRVLLLGLHPCRASGRAVVVMVVLMVVMVMTMLVVMMVMMVMMAMMMMVMAMMVMVMMMVVIMMTMIMMMVVVMTMRMITTTMTSSCVAVYSKARSRAGTR